MNVCQTIAVSGWRGLWAVTLLPWLLGGTLLTAGPALAQEDGADQIRIACVGDSITEGHLAKHEAWPLLLERLIDQKARGRYVIGNFGKGGATLLRNSATPYANTGQYKASQEFQPDIVIINLGVNDAHHGFWRGDRDEFQSGLIELVGVYQSLASQPTIYLSSITTMYPAWPQWESSIDNLVLANEIIRDVAQRKGLPVIDLTTPTAGNPGLFPDGLHPNRSGNWIIAQAVYDALAGKDIVAVDHDQVVMLEAEAFEQRGGWVVDTQFVDAMGSPFLIAHGLGQPVADAITEVRFPQSGQWRVWVRTRDWTRSFGREEAPGRFELRVGDITLEPQFGTEQADWHWQDGGITTIERETTVRLHDLTGFAGRCDAIVFMKDVFAEPPSSPKLLAEFRRQAMRYPRQPIEEGRFDLVVVGGNLAGTAAAVSAAREGLMVALLHDRPVLGGELSSEVRMAPEGATHQEPYSNLGDLVDELLPPGTATGADRWPDRSMLAVVEREPNVRLFLNHHVQRVEVSNGAIIALRSRDLFTGETSRFRGRWYVDASPGAPLGVRAGAEFALRSSGHMGASVPWSVRAIELPEDASERERREAREGALFPRCPWALDLSDRPFPGRPAEQGAVPDFSRLGDLRWQAGFTMDPVAEAERIRDQNYRAMFGAWDALKNVEQAAPLHRLDWASVETVVRESRRLLGDYVVTGEDLRKGNLHEDGAVPCTWPLETHQPNPAFAGAEGEAAFVAIPAPLEGSTYTVPFWAPYRALYSRNIENLFLAGINVSAEPEALGALRAARTAGVLGEVVGMAASLCARKECTPREVYREYLPELKELLERGVAR